MDAKNISGLNYDDFYKFLTSFSILTFIFCIYAAGQQMTKIYARDINQDALPMLWASFYIYVILFCTSAFFFIRAMTKWQENQHRIDKILELKLKKVAAEYEKQIMELTEGEKLNPLEDATLMAFRKPGVKRAKVEGRIYKTIKK